MNIYTKTGDTGQTDIIGERVDKDHLRISTIGTLDELNSLLGIARAKSPLQNVGEALKYLQGALFSIGALIAGTSDKAIKVPKAKNLEEVIDEISKLLPPLENFILPGGHETASFLHHARSVCRRSERLIVALNKKEKLDKGILEFMNRTSDFLFVMARYVNHHYMLHETIWEGGTMSQAEDDIEDAPEKEETKGQTITIEEAVEAAEANETEEETVAVVEVTPEVEPEVEAVEVEAPPVETTEEVAEDAKAQEVTPPVVESA